MSNALFEACKSTSGDHDMSLSAGDGITPTRTLADAGVERSLEDSAVFYKKGRACPHYTLPLQLAL